MAITYSSEELAGVPASVIERSRRLVEELKARPKDAPISELGKSLAAIRQRYIDNGGTFAESEEDFQRLVRSYRFGIDE
ncbi:MAG: hypothetical protein IJS87_00525 [Rhodocyclaceae bacterium]|nr:hypothetical protein [Rhodocyclaceae bacterium]